MNNPSISVLNHEYKNDTVKDEQEIWVAFLNDDRTAFAKIYNGHIAHLYNYGMKINPDNELIEDCIQELFIDLWNQRKNLSQNINVKFYLLKALRYKIFRVISSVNKRKQNLNSNYLPYQFKEDLPYEDLIINEQVTSEKRIKLYKALDKLSFRQREVLNLIFFEKYSYERISEIMSMNIKSVYTLAWKALSALKRADLLILIIAGGLSN